jgi:rhodanese-related sulfurtransferase
MINTIKRLLGVKPPADYKQLIADGAIILDVRTPGEFRGGHARGAINMPLNTLHEYINKQKNKDRVIITCCASGMRSGSAKSMLQKAGFAHVYNAGPWNNLNF